MEGESDEDGGGGLHRHCFPARVRPMCRRRPVNGSRYIIDLLTSAKNIAAFVRLRAIATEYGRLRIQRPIALLFCASPPIRRLNISSAHERRRHDDALVYLMMVASSIPKNDVQSTRQGASRVHTSPPP